MPTILKCVICGENTPEDNTFSSGECMRCFRLETPQAKKAWKQRIAEQRLADREKRAVTIKKTHRRKMNLVKQAQRRKDIVLERARIQAWEEREHKEIAQELLIYGTAIDLNELTVFQVRDASYQQNI